MYIVMFIKERYIGENRDHSEENGMLNRMEDEQSTFKTLGHITQHTSNRLCLTTTLKVQKHKPKPKETC